jgi:hypothetical protein
VMTLDASEFIRRFLMHVLPSGFHRIRYYGFLTCQTRAKNIERIRELLAVPLIPLDAIKAAKRQDFDERSARGAKSTRASMPLLRQQHAHHRDLPARATAETQAHASSAKDQDRHLMMTKLMLDICKYDQCLCWLPADNVVPCVVTSMLPFGKTQKRKDCLTKTIRDPFKTQFTPMPRGKIAYVAASFRHIDACARGEIPIVAAPPPFPTRDFLPWRFSAAGPRRAWRDRHSGGRKPAQTRTLTITLARRTIRALRR